MAQKTNTAPLQKAHHSNAELLARAEKVIPGGVNSPVRAFRSVGGTPRFIARGDGPYLIDCEGTSYIDFVCSWGPLILGHNAELIRDAVTKAMSHGTSFGAPTEAEVDFAELLVSLLPGMDMVRMVSSGTEAMMSAIRLARGFTGRDYVIKCNGCYHGHADSFLVQAGSGAATHGISGSAGVPADVASLTLSVEFNDLALMQETVERVGPHTIAAIAVEPVPGNMGLILPKPGYLEGLRALCNEHGIVLIFDEVMSGFRVGLRGASERYGIVPDLAAYGKVVGGGLPLAVFGGKHEIMSNLAPLGPVYQAGTLSGNPLAVAAGRAVVRWLIEHNPYALLEERAKQLTNGFAEAAAKYGLPFQRAYCGSMFGFFFAKDPVYDFSTAKLCDQKLFNSFFQQMLNEGVYLAPSAFEAGFMSTSHTPKHIETAVAAADRVMSRM